MKAESAVPEQAAQERQRSADLVWQQQHSLSQIFNPKSVAVLGASQRMPSVGRAILWNLLTSPFGGTVYPVDPERTNLFGVRTYASLRDLPELVDLVIISNLADAVPQLVKEAVELGIGAAIVISAGFREIGEHGKQLEAEILGTIQGKMRVIGPNCLGVMNPITGLNATFAPKIARPGKVAFASQSGALCTAVLDWSLKENVGFSAFVSIGSMLDVGWGDLIDYFGNDAHTSSIVIYMESIGDARFFLSAAREVSLTKPIIVIKAGRTAAAAKAAASHTGLLTGREDVLEAAFRRTGVLRVDSIEDVFYMTDVLAKQPRPKGKRLCIISNAGGPGVLATDALIHGGGELATLSPGSMDEFNKILPPIWSHNNPVDIVGDADAERYSKSLEIAAKDESVDGMLVILAPVGLRDPTSIAEKIRQFARCTGKPVLASWMGGPAVASGVKAMNEAGIPTFEFPDTAMRVFNYMWRYSYNLKSIYETPQLPSVDCSPDRRRAAEIINSIRNSGRTILSEYESKKLLQAYGIPTVPAKIAVTKEEAVRIAETFGYPIVLKLYSLTVTHKADVGGVKLDLRNSREIEYAFEDIRESVTNKVGAESFQGVTVQPMINLDGYEIIIGSSIDSQFGPVLLFGAGGQLVEICEDHSIALPPLNSTLARRMMEQTNIYKALQGIRGRKPVDLRALETVMVRFSELVVEQPWIREIDINPLLASPERLLALDARVMLHGRDVSEASLPRTAIRPYPLKYVNTWKMKDGEEVLIRPIRPEDEPLIVKFHEKLSDRSVYMRYFHPLRLSQRTAHEGLTRVCFIDYDREMELVVERRTESGEPEILAAGRMSKLHARNEAELAALVRDDYQAKGLGTELYRRMIQIARDEKLLKVISTILGDNREMRSLVIKLGFKAKMDLEDNVIEAELVL